MRRANPIATSREEANRQAALFRLSAELAEPLTDDEIYEQLVSGLHATLGYEIVAVFTVEKGTSIRHLSAYAGYQDPKSPLPEGVGISEAAVLDGKQHYVPDVSKTPKYFYGAGGSEVDVPVKVRNEVASVLVAERTVIDGFDKEDIDVLAAAANIAGLALEKNRLIAKEQRRVEQLEALRKTSREITGELDLDALLLSIVDRAAKLLNATGGELGLVEDGKIRLVVSHNIGPGQQGRLLTMGKGLMGSVAQSGEAKVIEDYQQWPDRLAEYPDIHSTVCVPLKLGGRVLGCFTTARMNDYRAFSDDDLYLLTLFAQQAVVAVENARLYEESQMEILRRREAQLEVSRQKEYYKALLVNNPEAVVVADIEGNIISWNPRAEELFGYSFAEVEGRNLDIFLAADASLFDEARENTQLLIDSRLVHKSTQRTRKDGSLVDVELLALPIFVDKEKTGFIAIYHDLTEAKGRERELIAQNDRLSRDMELAGEIQKGFVRGELPQVSGWEISAKLLPAREASGDFYSIRELPDGQLSILIADVLDKGVGAALIMALTWTLFRISTQEYGHKPERVFREVNQHLIQDTKSDQFLTAFYGVLDPQTGILRYCNAGHNPPYLFPLKTRGKLDELRRTGMPLGIELNERWEEKEVVITENEMLLMYTDGLTEGINSREQLYGEQRLQKVMRGKRRATARQVRKAIIDSFHDFIGAQAQSDDIGLIVVKRKIQRVTIFFVKVSVKEIL
jgi:PAS domain S-box-containing protein